MSRRIRVSVVVNHHRFALPCIAVSQQLASFVAQQNVQVFGQDSGNHHVAWHNAQFEGNLKVFLVSFVQCLENPEHRRECQKKQKNQGKYYTLSEKRIPYQRDKTQDSRNRFWILTLFAIAMELEQKSQIQPEDVIQVELPIGLPPKHFAELCERYERYFKGDGKVQELCFNDKVYHLCIQNVMAFPQDYAAMMTRMMEIREIPKVVGIDIGGFTSDYLLMRSGRPDMDYCDSLEKGVITMYNDIISSINSEYDMLLEEADIDSIIKGKTQYYEEAVVQAVETMVQNFVTDLLNSIRERGIDTKSTYTVFIGGGAVLLERFLEQADRLGKHTFIRDMKANADGYDLLYRMTQAGV